jgi:hypothetical protein
MPGDAPGSRLIQEESCKTGSTLAALFLFFVANSVKL